MSQRMVAMLIGRLLADKISNSICPGSGQTMADLSFLGGRSTPEDRCDVQRMRAVVLSKNIGWAIGCTENVGSGGNGEGRRSVQLVDGSPR